MSLSLPVQDIPFLLPPPGHKSNFENPETLGPTIIKLCSICLTLMWLSFLLSVYTKVWVKRCFGWDDGKALFYDMGTPVYVQLQGLLFLLL